MLKLKLKEKVRRPYVRFVISGPGGGGKSTGIGKIAKKPLLIDLDRRWPAELVSKTDTIDTEESFKAVKDTLEALLKEPKLDNDWLVIDTVTRLMTVVEQHTVASDFKGDKDKYHAYGAGLRFAPQYFIELLDLIDAIQLKHSINVAMICHTKVKTIANPTGKDYVKQVLDLPDVVADRLKQWADYVGYAHFDVSVAVEGFKGKAQGQVRVISFNDSPLFDAKNGSPFTLPNKIIFDKEGKWAQVVFGGNEELIKELDGLVAQFPEKARNILLEAIEQENVKARNPKDLKDFIEKTRESLKGAKQ